MKRSEAMAAQAEVRARLEEFGIVLDPAEVIEVTDFGLHDYQKQGLGLVVRVNEPEYCSKWLVLRPGQECPLHLHRVKKETFFVLQGEVRLWADGRTIMLTPGEHYTITPGIKHTFDSMSGAIIEEVSTHDENSDSYFGDPNIVRDVVIEEDP